MEFCQSPHKLQEDSKPQMTAAPANTLIVRPWAEDPAQLSLLLTQGIAR